MLNKTQLIEKINFHFPSYEAVDGINYGAREEDSIFFLGEASCSNLINDTLIHYDEFGEYKIDRSKGEGCPVTVFLERHDWYVEQWDEETAYAVKDTYTKSEWDRLIEKSKTVKLDDGERNKLQQIQKKLLRTGK